MSRPKFCCPMGSFFCMIITLLILLLGLPRLTALTMAASIDSMSMAVSARLLIVADWIASLLELIGAVLELLAGLLELIAGLMEFFTGLLEFALILVCCAESVVIDKPMREISALKMRCFFMDEVFFHPEHSQSGGDISLRRHYPDQVGGYDLSALLEAPRMMSQR